MKPFHSYLRFPRALQAYLLFWYLAGSLALFWSICSLARSNWRPALWYVAVACALSLKAVRGASKSSLSRASVSMASAAGFAAIIGVGPLAGALVEAGSTVLDSVFPRRRALYQALFNISVVSVGAGAAGVVYHALGGPTITFRQWSPLVSIAAAAGPMLIATTTYWLVNTVAVAEVVSLASGTPFRDVWERNFKTTFVAYATGGSCAIIILGLSGHMAIISLVLLCAPIIYASYSREQTDEARIVALERGKEHLEKLYLASIRTLAHTIAAKDRYTNGHIHRVTSYAVAIAHQMNLSDEDITDLQTGALLHDIGKIGVPESILSKPAKLAPEEMAMMQQHSEVGWAILQPLELPDIVKQIVRNHHEWYNGCGYPDRLRGDAIPPMVRIVSICDVFDALTSDRPYRDAMSIEDSREIMRRSRGSQFDPEILDAFFTVLDTIPFEELRKSPSESPVLVELLSTLQEPVEHPGSAAVPSKDQRPRTAPAPANPIPPRAVLPQPGEAKG